MSKVLMGINKISNYMGVSRVTLHRWRKKYGFPMATEPGGMTITTESLIDMWILNLAMRQEKVRGRVAKIRAARERQPSIGFGIGLTDPLETQK